MSSPVWKWQEHPRKTRFSSFVNESPAIFTKNLRPSKSPLLMCKRSSRGTGGISSGICVCLACVKPTHGKTSKGNWWNPKSKSQIWDLGSDITCSFLRHKMHDECNLKGRLHQEFNETMYSEHRLWIPIPGCESQLDQVLVL